MKHLARNVKHRKLWKSGTTKYTVFLIFIAFLFLLGDASSSKVQMSETIPSGANWCQQVPGEHLVSPGNVNSCFFPGKHNADFFKILKKYLM